MSLFSLENKIAVVTGGASGIGEAISKAFAGQGAHVHILEFNAENGERVVGEIKSMGGKANFHACDVSNNAQVAQIISAIGNEGYIHILVNNAGIAHVGNLEGTAEEDMDRIYNVNIKGVYNCMHAVITKMKEKGGVILNMASIASTVGISDRFAYSMSKGAVLTMTYSVAKDYLDQGIRCNSISPARIHTPFVDGFIKKNYPGKEAEMFEKLSKSQPIGRMGKPEEVANLAVYLCSDEASFITGTDFPIDGGYIKLNG
ncbi:MULTISPECIES: SDR family NAD(P)-dependent oxidoreductase [unclassified Arenibacter]|jgi:NAD(P)-dependent dehydrogenase (short-subunit alcohol dehydrogenase family)|uniref:SDR family NAD(P)-dependent oxidoreductase n=1 Tax=unclassified Arenibacter TaxID=2615047 RepID=UPI000E34EB5B|nr:MULTISPECIES: SDR family oxidoreductase [unclassified Arenibacter]MCM4162206.1 short-chain dehydrogenase [Arenibacter sp. A80]RFT57815.1 SDR family oxidoreductase [Arenibacter sp. P308M17]